MESRPGHWFDCAIAHCRSCCHELLGVLPAAILAVTAAGKAGSHLPADLTHAAQEAVSCLYSLLQAFGLEVASADGQPGAEGICLTADAMMSILQVGSAGSGMAHLYLPLHQPQHGWPCALGALHDAPTPLLLPPVLDVFPDACSLRVVAPALSLMSPDALPQQHGVVMQGSSIAREAMSSAAATLQCAAALPRADAGQLAEAVANGLFGRPGGRWHAADASAGECSGCLR